MLWKFFAGAGLLAAMMTVPAFADELITYTYKTTTQISGFDGDDDFGMGPYGLLSSVPAVVTFTVDLGKGTPVYNPDFATYLQVGWTQDLSQLNVWASITINGHTVTPARLPYGTSAYGETRVNGALVAQAFSVETVDPTERAISSFTFQYSGTSIEPIGFYENFTLHQEGTVVELNPVAPVVTVTETTPEPASFLLLGTGLIGLAYPLRRRFCWTRA